MSFHFKLSSDEEEEEEKEDWFQRNDDGDSNSKPSAFSSTEPAVAVAHANAVARTPSPAFSFNTDNLVDSEESSDEEVDWEDAEEEEQSKPPAKPAAAVASLKPVTIDLGQDKKKEPNKQGCKRKRTVRKVYRYRSLPQNLQWQLLNLHQAHLLALTSRAVYLSCLCSDYELLHVAHSLIPERFWNDSNKAQTAPSVTEARNFLDWYFDLVNHTAERRRQGRLAHSAAGARGPGRGGRKRTKKTTEDNKMTSRSSTDLAGVCHYLSSTHDDDPLLVEEEVVISDPQKSLLLVCMARSLGWKTRYITALEPCKTDLDTNHPLLLNNAVSIFQSVQKRFKTTGDEPVSQKKARLDKTTIEAGEGLVTLDMPGSSELGWVEILCLVPTKTASGKKRGDDTSVAPKCRWIHVDPTLQAIDRPNLVECVLYANNRQRALSSKRRDPIRFVLAVEHRPMLMAAHDGSALLRWMTSDTELTSWNAWNHTRIMDVTQRYAQSWSQTVKLRGSNEGGWWTGTLATCNRFYKARAVLVARTYERRILQTQGASTSDAIEIDNEKQVSTPTLAPEDESHVVDEKSELQAAAEQEAIPTSKAAFKNHPVYAIQSSLNSTEVLAPDAKTRMCGIFKGEIVFRRSDVSMAMPAKKWLYKGRKVKEEELKKPVKRVKAPKRASPKGFQALRSYGVGTGNDGSVEARQREIEKGSAPEEEFDGMNSLYAIWQTVPWSPVPVGPNDPIPVNDYNNIELELINPSLTHLDEPRISTVAKKLGIPYAPCLLGFEGHGGNRTPTIRGIVVHNHNIEILREAHAEVQSHAMEQEHEDRQQSVYKRWKKLMVGVLTKDRLEREYGNSD